MVASFDMQKQHVALHVPQRYGTVVCLCFLLYLHGYQFH